MAFVKLDTGILDSTLWIERECREIFITALLMAEPYELTDPQEQIEVDTLNTTGFFAPPGWYGFVRAAGGGIVNRAGLPRDAGMEALRKLCSPEMESRSQDFDGRRMIRIDGGYLILNYMKYRDYDHTAAERMRRLRARNKGDDAPPNVTANGYGDTANVTDDVTDFDDVRPNVTYSRGQRAEADIKDKDKDKSAAKKPPRAVILRSDGRRGFFRERLEEYWKIANPQGPPMTWGPAEDVELEKLLSQNLSLTVAEFARLLSNRSRSLDGSPSELVRVWLVSVLRYSAPLNKYGRPFDPDKPEEGKNAKVPTSKAQRTLEVVNRSLARGKHQDPPWQDGDLPSGGDGRANTRTLHAGPEPTAGHESPADGAGDAGGKRPGGGGNSPSPTW